MCDRPNHFEKVFQPLAQPGTNLSGVTRSRRSSKKCKNLNSATPLTLDSALVEVVAVKAATLHDVLRLVWVYIKSNELLLAGGFVSVDTKLGAIVGPRSLVMPSKVLMARVMHHMERTFAA